MIGKTAVRRDRLGELRKAGRVKYTPRSRKARDVIRTFRLDKGMKLERVVKGTH